MYIALADSRRFKEEGKGKGMENRSVGQVEGIQEEKEKQM